MLVKCPVCKGEGEYEAYSEVYKNNYPVKCTLCSGSGKVERSYISWLCAKRKIKSN